MATLNSLKQVLTQKAKTPAKPETRPLSDTQYSAGFDILRQSERKTYQDFIVPQLSRMVTPLFDTRTYISVLEIGPGPETVLGYLPSYLRRKVRRYTAFEPNEIFATKLKQELDSTSATNLQLPRLDGPSVIYQKPFVVEDNAVSDANTQATDGDDKYDLVLFCHSMYMMKPKNRFIERALELLDGQSPGGMVVVFHRDSLRLDSLVCHRTASFPTGTIRVADDDKALEHFAPFVAGFVMQSVDGEKTVQSEWRKVCRAMGRRDEVDPGYLLFSSPTIMVAFTRPATTLSELEVHVPLLKAGKLVKNYEARSHRPARIFRPTEAHLVQQCVRWALKYGLGLTVVSGGHSGHCLWPNVVAVDMGAFDQVHIIAVENEDYGSGSPALVIAGSGCKAGDIIRQTMAAGLTVPLGARPSVGAGLWLQGGIGHLARLHGLACDAIVGAVVVGVESGQILYVGCVPTQHRPAGAVRAENEPDLLWSMQGAGTNCGIVISVTFMAYPAPTYLVRNWTVPLSDKLEARQRLSDFDELVANEPSRNCSVDAYLYWNVDQLHLGITVFESSTTRPISGKPMSSTRANEIWGPETDSNTVDGLGLFETDMYISGMHGGHGSGKTSSFKRCLFFKSIGQANIINRLVEAIEARPSSLCYMHLLQGGGAIGDVAPDATAFGCRDWDFACVITGVWPRDEDGTEAAQSAVRWVYNVAGDLLPLSRGSYGADLGPDPRDAVLAARAFGPNRPRLAHLKHSLDPHNVLAYACPLTDFGRNHQADCQSQFV